jgi:hypothetical protein
MLLRHGLDLAADNVERVLQRARLLGAEGLSGERS